MGTHGIDYTLLFFFRVIMFCTDVYLLRVICLTRCDTCSSEVADVAAYLWRFRACRTSDREKKRPMIAFKNNELRFSSESIFESKRAIDISGWMIDAKWMSRANCTQEGADQESTRTLALQRSLSCTRQAHHLLGAIQYSPSRQVAIAKNIVSDPSVRV